MRRRGLLALGSAALAAGCSPYILPAGAPTVAPSFSTDALLMPDGARLPLHAWMPETPPPRAAVIALHGFNEYSRSFAEDPAPLFTQAGIALYAYDQRGFGRAPHRGIWPGAATLAADASTAAKLIRARHPDIPLVMMGESMGGAVLMVAATSADPPPVDGYVLLAPAVWGRSTMPAIMRWTLDLALALIPAIAFSNSAPGFTPTNNLAALRRWSRDPLIIRETRIDAVGGLVDLMDAAVAAAPRFTAPALLLFGGDDRLVPSDSTRAMLRRLPPLSTQRVAYYPGGYHMLLRDRDGPKVVQDIAAWVLDHAAPLPSGADQAARAWLTS